MVGDLLVAHHHLDDAGGLAQVEERDAAVVAPPGHPAGQGDGLSDVLGAQAACVMGADHWCCSSLADRVVDLRTQVLGRGVPGVGVGVDLLAGADVLDLVGHLGVGGPWAGNQT